MKFIPLNCKSHYSVRQALCRPKDLDAAVKDIGHEAFGVADFDVISGSVKFKSINKRCLIGTELVVSGCGPILIYAKNKEGWKRLCSITGLAQTNQDSSISRESIIQLYDESLLTYIYLYPDNKPLPGSYYGIDLHIKDGVMRSVAQAKNFPSVCVHEIRYPKITDSIDFGLLLSIADNVSIQDVYNKYANYFKDLYHVPTIEELLAFGYTKAEIEKTYEIYQGIDQYDLSNNPRIPKFDCGPGVTSKEQLEKICRKGKTLTKEQEERLKKEFEVIFGYHLEDYFLIIHDIVDYTDRNYGISGIRGSGAGSIISYLSGISKIDPLKYNLLFERFLNAGRFSEGRIQLPDIDIDVPADAREGVINYIVQKYGRDKVGQILTYQRIKTAAAIKAVFRANGGLSFKEVNDITRKIPDVAKISDKLKEMGLESPLLYCLTVYPDDFRQWVSLDDNGEISGPYANEFKQVLRLEGLNSARSKHAAGVIIAPEPLTDFCPMIRDGDSGRLICGMEMDDLEKIGGLKVDVLGLRLFDKIIQIKDIVENAG